MSDGRRSDSDRDEFADSPVSPADVASAGRSCSVILIVAAVTLLLICVATLIRLAFTS